MLKKMRNLFLMVGISVLLFSLSVSADYERVPVNVNGTMLSGYLVEEKTMVPLIEFCRILDGGASSSLSGNVISVKTRGMTVSAAGGERYIEANGRCFYTDINCRTIGGVLYVPIRPLAKAYAADVFWSNATRSVAVSDHGGTCAPADSVYWDGAVLWLSRIIYAESRGEPFLGKIAVGNVVMNRVDSALFPNTIYSVIFDRKYGVQFTPVSSGTIYNNSNAECIRAAKMVLEGTTMNDDVLYFLNPAIATNSWIQKNRTFAFAIGNHHFYY